jgi:hypothetical protein
MRGTEYFLSISIFGADFFVMLVPKELKRVPVDALLPNSF